MIYISYAILDHFLESLLNSKILHQKASMPHQISSKATSRSPDYIKCLTESRSQIDNFGVLTCPIGSYGQLNDATVSLTL